MSQSLTSQTAKEHKRQMITIFDPEQPKSSTAQNRLGCKRVAAYARVSTELDSQQNSYEAQIDYYTTHIQSRPDWEFVAVYSDEGITGTSYKKRDGFNRMVRDAMDGKIDLILTKSISRFARNTVDALTITRQLKSAGIEVFFEKENISSMDSQAELVFTIMSSIAQEESRSISENVRWGLKRSMEAGKVSLPWKHFLGFERGPDGLPKIVESEAAIVRIIYHNYLDGATLQGIAKSLTKQGIKAPCGGQKWSPETIRNILTNEKYMGDAILQKTYTVDFLSKEIRKNNGERKQWYIHDSHDAIITPETFKLVQQELKYRGHPKGKFYDSPFYSKVRCGLCKACYNHYTVLPEREERFNLWACRNKFNTSSKCCSPMISERKLRQAFRVALARLFDAYADNLKHYDRELTSVIFSKQPQSRVIQPAPSLFDAKIIYHLVEFAIIAKDELYIKFKDGSRQKLQLSNLSQ